MVDSIMGIHTVEGTGPSWQNILVTLLMASAAVYFFFTRQQPTTSHTTTLNDDERRKRRERLAELAEQRAAATRVQEATAVDESKTSEELNNGQPEKPKKEDERLDSTSIDKDTASEQNVSNIDEEGNAASNNTVHGEDRGDTNNGSGIESDTCKNNSNNTGTDENDEAEERRKEESRERTQKAIAKIMAAKKEGKTRPFSASKNITVYLILTAVPNSRIEISIPHDISSVGLLRRVSQTSGIPEQKVKVIFRGKIVTEHSTASGTKSVVDEFGIENDCVLHVVGKPTQPNEEGGDGDPEEHENNNNGSDNEDVNDEVYEPFFLSGGHSWEELPPHIELAAAELGWNPSSWDNGVPSVPDTEDLTWEELSPLQQEAATVLGYNNESWNKKGDSSSGEEDDSSDSEDEDDQDSDSSWTDRMLDYIERHPEVGDYSEGDENNNNGSDTEGVNADEVYEAFVLGGTYRWAELSLRIRIAASALGWTPTQWDNGIPSLPDTENLTWEELGPGERGAAILLGYNQESWNDEEGSDSEGENEDDNITAENGVSQADRDRMAQAIRRSTGEALYHRAAREGDLATIIQADRAGLHDLLRLTDANGWSPVHEAARSGEANILQYLVEEIGLPIDGEHSLTRHGDTPLSIALQFHGREHPVVVRILSLQGEDPHANPWAESSDDA